MKINTDLNANSLILWLLSGIKTNQRNAYVVDYFRYFSQRYSINWRSNQIFLTAGINDWCILLTRGIIVNDGFRQITIEDVYVQCLYLLIRIFPVERLFFQFVQENNSSLNCQPWWAYINLLQFADSGLCFNNHFCRILGPDKSTD